MAQVTIDVDDDVLRLVDDVARRVGLPREAMLARVVRQETAASVLTELFQGREDGLSDDEAERTVEAERATMRADRRAGGATGGPAGDASLHGDRLQRLHLGADDQTGEPEPRYRKPLPPTS